MEYADNDRRLRVEYPGAMYHVTSRGVVRSPIYRCDGDRIAFFERCEKTVDRFGWLVFAAMQMTNHFHMVFQTPEANLCDGAQYLLGGYATKFNRSHGRTGHVFEGRYRAKLIESDEYLWTVSRYAHLNATAIVNNPAEWPWSSYPGYCNPSLRLPWVCYDRVLQLWQGEFGSAPKAYCQFVERGLVDPKQARLPEMIDNWIIGSPEFAERIRTLISPRSNEPNVLRARNRPLLSMDEMLRAVCESYRLKPEVLAKPSSRHPARAVLAILAQRYSIATLDQIAGCLGLAGRDSVHKIIQRHSAKDLNGFAEALKVVEKCLRGPQ